jgi:hypothetical protein
MPTPTLAIACKSCSAMHTPHPLYVPCCSALCLSEWAQTLAAQNGKPKPAKTPKRPHA